MRHPGLILLLAVLAGPALADPPWARSGDDSRGRGERHEQYEKKEKREKYGKHEPRGYFMSDDRIVIRDYYQRNPGHLPPGLAKRGGNLPPGLAKRQGGLPPGLAKGQVIDPRLEVELLPLPRELEIRLPPPPHEVIRRIIGRDILLIHEHNRKVLDILRDALPPPPR